MSGPKTSHYTLTQEQRRILAEQRQRRLQLERIKKQRDDARSIVVEADQIIAKMEPLCRETDGDMGVLDQIRVLRTQSMELIRHAQQMDEGSELTALQKMNQDLRAVTSKLEAVNGKAEKDYSVRDKAFRTEMSERISQGFGISFADLGGGLQKHTYREKIMKKLEDLSALVLSDAQESALADIRKKADRIEDAGFLKNFYAMTVVPFVKECRSYHAAYTAYGEAYEQKWFVYESNARALGIHVEEIPFSADAISVLDDRIRETEAAILFREEQAYISRCVDEAMQEMGYAVLGDREIVKRSGKKFRNELYLFDEGTAVNVTYSSDGQITMELGGISTDDRIPSQAESTGLVSNMRTFCDDYYEIERRLRQKGILTKRIAILPPDAQYAQMINISDYHLRTAVSEYEVGREKKQAVNAMTRKIGE